MKSILEEALGTEEEFIKAISSNLSDKKIFLNHLYSAPIDEMFIMIYDVVSGAMTEGILTICKDYGIASIPEQACECCSTKSNFILKYEQEDKGFFLCQLCFILNRMRGLFPKTRELESLSYDDLKSLSRSIYTDLRDTVGVKANVGSENLKSNIVKHQDFFDTVFLYSSEITGVEKDNVTKEYCTIQNFCDEFLNFFERDDKGGIVDFTASLFAQSIVLGRAMSQRQVEFMRKISDTKSSPWKKAGAIVDSSIAENIKNIFLDLGDVRFGPRGNTADFIKSLHTQFISRKQLSKRQVYSLEKIHYRHRNQHNFKNFKNVEDYSEYKLDGVKLTFISSIKNGRSK